MKIIGQSLTGKAVKLSLVILLLSATDSMAQSGKWYFGMDLEPWSLPLQRVSIGAQAGYFGNESSFLEVEARAGEYAGEENNVKGQFFKPFEYRMAFTSLGVKLGLGSSYKSKIRFYYFLGGDMYVWGGMHDIVVDYYDNHNPSIRTYSFHAGKFPQSIGMSLYLLGLRIVAPVCGMDAELTTRILPGLLSMNRTFSQGNDDGVGPVPQWFLFSVGVRL